MAPQLSSSPLIDRELLYELADLRLREAQTLLSARMFVGAVHLAGYAVECQLKFAICSTLDWGQLRRTFQTHDLELLLLHSGFDSTLQREPDIQESFSKIRSLWSVEGTSSIRYDSGQTIDEGTARLFLKCVDDPRVGVIPWLRKMTS